MTRLSLVLLALGVSVGASACAWECTLVGCSSEVAMKRSVSATDADLLGAVARLCVGEDCKELTLQARADGGFEGDASLSGFEAEAAATPTGTGTFDVVLRRLVTNAGDDEEPAAVSYAYRLTASDGVTVIAEATGAPKYTEDHPNGESCDPVCYQGEI